MDPLQVAICIPRSSAHVSATGPEVSACLSITGRAYINQKEVGAVVQVWDKACCKSDDGLTTMTDGAPGLRCPAW